tara:strand:+ start:4825 stop:5223 length:399 start_codon:yes stop_codon:yes gene_type:complete
MEKIALLFLLGVSVMLLTLGASPIPTITKEDVRKEIIKNKILFPEIVLAQSILETGWYKCKNCSLRKNNIFGFWYKGAYIEYSSWQESVSYYARWQSRHYDGGDYYEFLKKVGYAEDPEYCNKLKIIVNEKL